MMTTSSHSIVRPNPVARKRCFEPVVDHRTRILILGSLPSEQSLARQEYYGNPQNRFWMLMSEVIGQDLLAQDYKARLQALLANGVGLWDVVAEANREGSLDHRIRDHADNDLVGLLIGLLNMTTIAFNGGAAARLGIKVLGPQAERYRVVRLPSSSPANTAPYAEKLVLAGVARGSRDAVPGWLRCRYCLAVVAN
jgi:hypoxanthine-DNA glycosylase